MLSLTLGLLLVLSESDGLDVLEALPIFTPNGLLVHRASVDFTGG